MQRNVIAIYKYHFISVSLLVGAFLLKAHLDRQKWVFTCIRDIWVVLIVISVLSLFIIISMNFIERLNERGLLPVSPQDYDIIPVIEPEDVGVLKDEVDLSRYFPPVRDQGTQGSCVGWAAGYYLRSYLENRKRGLENVVKDKLFTFSPAFIFNQIRSNDKCLGSMLPDALKLLHDAGVCFWSTFPYKWDSCCSSPNDIAYKEAVNFRIRGWGKVDYKDTGKLKRMLQAGKPVLMGINVSTSFDLLRGDKCYTHNTLGATTGHAIVCVGFSEKRKAFRFINSWGEKWGDKGFAWIDYECINNITTEAYAADL